MIDFLPFPTRESGAPDVVRINDPDGTYILECAIRGYNGWAQIIVAGTIEHPLEVYRSAASERLGRELAIDRAHFLTTRDKDFPARDMLSIILRPMH